MKKKFLYFIITFILIMFANIQIINAEEYIFERKYFPGDTDEEKDEIINEFLNSNINNDVIKIYYGNRWVYYSAFLHRESLSEFEEFKIDTVNGGAANLQYKLQQYSSACAATKDNCQIWMQENYCNKDWKNANTNSNYYKFCYAVIKGDDEKTCPYALDTEEAKDLNMSYVILPEGDSTTGATITFQYDANKNFDYENGIYSSNGTTLYLHGYNEDFISFSNKFMELYINNKKICPTLAYCQGAKNKNNWYAVFDKTECSNLEYYTGKSQETDEDGTVTEEGITRLPLKDLIYQLFGEENTNIDCDAIFQDNSLRDMLKTMVNVVKIIVPIILLVLGSLDFAKAVFASDENAIKKAQQAFIKRLIIAVAIFLIPSVLKLILTIAHTAWESISPDFCGIL